MSWLEFIATILCALAGFGLVSLILNWKANPTVFSSDESDSTAQDDEPSVTNGGGPKAWWEVLGVDQKASAHEIQRAYRKKIRQYHPDRVEGLGEEFGKLAEVRAKELNRAYAEAKRQRGL